MKLRREPYLLSQKNTFSQKEFIPIIPIKKDEPNIIPKKTNFLKKTFFYVCALSVIITGLSLVSMQLVNEYSTYKSCQSKSGIWDKENSICGFLVIYGSNFELRKVVID